MSQSKGQIFSIDFVITLFTIVIILITTAWVWDYQREKTIYVNERGNLENIAYNQLSVFIETEGNPSNWDNLSRVDFNVTKIFSLGLAKAGKKNDILYKGNSQGLSKNNYLVLDEEKLQRLNELLPEKYNESKRIFGIQDINLNYLIRIKIWNGTLYKEKYNFGLTPNKSIESIKIERFALINDTWSSIAIFLWKRCDGIC